MGGKWSVRHLCVGDDLCVGVGMSLFLKIMFLTILGMVWLLGADTLIAWVLVNPGMSENIHWVWVNQRPYLAIVGAMMNVTLFSFIMVPLVRL